MFEFEDPRFLRWLALAASLTIEATAFWFGGPPSDPTQSFASNLLLKAESAGSWTWLGWVSFSLTWLWVELVRLPFLGSRRVRKYAHDNEDLQYVTGLHWLVLLRDVHTGEINDGDDEELNEELFPRTGARSATWYIVWLPIWLALFTTLFFVGLAANAVRNFPGAFADWCSSALAYLHTDVTGASGPFAALATMFFSWLPIVVADLVAAGRANTWPLLAVLAAAWLVVVYAARAFAWVPLFRLAARIARWLLILAMMLVFVSAPWFDWMDWLYTYLPNNGPVAMAYFPLNFASALLVLHVALWSSWRYGVFIDRETGDATLIVVGGIFNFEKREFDLNRITETRIHQRWWQRLLGVGNLEIVEVGGARTDFIKHIAGPNRLDRAIKSVVRLRKRQHREHHDYEEE